FDRSVEGQLRELRDAGLAYGGVEWSTGVQGGVMSDSGVYAADYDSDGWTDLLALGGDRPVLFENDRGTLRPSGALPDLDRHVRTALFLDADNDRRQELVLFS
ncbi:MAG: FG-GAP repeat domain-containing protein, partial [Halobacteriaceae archaeon]